MRMWIDLILVLLMLSNFSLLGTSRLAAAIRYAAIQGVLLGIFTIFIEGSDLSWRITILGLVNMTLKGMLFPWLLFRSLREAGARRELKPYVSHVGSLLSGLALTIAAFWVGAHLPRLGPQIIPLLIPAAFSLLLTGLFIVASRRNALNQVVGYLVLENGIYIFGMGAVGRIPVLVELGVLLDVFVAVFVMVVAIHQLQQELEHIEIDQLSQLKG